MKPSSSQRLSRQGFSLVELIVVISIIVVLFSLVVGGFGYADRSSKRSRTEVTMRAIRSGLDLYKEKFGALPTYESGRAGESTTIGKLDYPVAGGACLYQALTGDGFDFIYIASDARPQTAPNSDGQVDQLEAANTILMNMPKELHAKTGTYHYIVDGFGHPMRYAKARAYDSQGNLINSAENNHCQPTVNRQGYDLWSVADETVSENIKMSSVDGRTQKIDQTWITNW